MDFKTTLILKCYLATLKLYNMDSLDLKGRWNVLKGKIKQQYADWTDDDLLYVEGKEDELYGRLQKKSGKTREEVQSWLRELDKD